MRKWLENTKQEPEFPPQTDIIFMTASIPYQ